MIKRTLCGLLCGLCGTVLTTGTAWGAFQDDFEASTPGGLPATATAGTMSAQPGEWFLYGSNTAGAVTVSDSPTPGAGEGSHYLSLERPSGGGEAIAAAFEPWNAPQVGGTVTAKWLMYLPTRTDIDYQAGIWLTGSLDNDHNNGLATASPVLFVTVDGQVRYSLNNFGTNAFLSAPVAQPDTWQEWTLVVDLDNQQATLDIDGTTSAPFGFNNDVNAANGLVFYGAQETDLYYVDDVRVNVPEPGSLGLASLGLGLLALRRRSH